MITLFLGGTRSGKSELAERYAATLPPPVTYVATWMAPVEPDADLEARIAAHRARRPAEWVVREAGRDLAEVVTSLKGTVLVDSVSMWVAGAPDFDVDAAGLSAALRARDGDTVMVSDEVGLGVHPSSAAGREFRDALGRVNQALAAVAGEAWLIVAGRALALVPPVWPELR